MIKWVFSFLFIVIGLQGVSSAAANDIELQAEEPELLAPEPQVKEASPLAPQSMDGFEGAWVEPFSPGPREKRFILKAKKRKQIIAKRAQRALLHKKKLLRKKASRKRNSQRALAGRAKSLQKSKRRLKRGSSKLSKIHRVEKLKKRRGLKRRKPASRKKTVPNHKQSSHR